MNQNKVLFIGLVWPEPTSSAAGKRILQLVEFFQNQGDEVIFSSAAAKTEASFDFTTMSLRDSKSLRGTKQSESLRGTKQSESLRGTKQSPIQLNNSSFNEFIRNLNPNIVVYDRFVSEEQFGWRVTQECPNALQILDTEDLHFLRFAREQAYKKKEPENLYNEIAVREIASILRCDLSLMISKFELNLVKKKFNIAPSLLHYLPFMELRLRSARQNSVIEQRRNDRKDFVFIGNFLHEPNWQTVLYLKKSIWPKIKAKLPKAKLHIYGAYPSQKVWDLHNEKEGFLVHGKAEDALKVISEARILLAPIPFGAGQKGKFIDAMQVGTPIATTSIGAESMFAEILPGIVEDDETEFVVKTIELFENENLWNLAQENGFKILKDHFDKDLFEKDFEEKIKNLHTNLTQHRNQNFIGQILKSNAANALKYMSLWIEEKNKSKK